MLPNDLPPTVLGLLGVASSGKDTLAKILQPYGWERLAFADALRDSVYNLNPIIGVNYVDKWDYSGGMCWGMGAKPKYAGLEAVTERIQPLVDRFGWDEVKTRYPEARELLQRLGTEVGRTLYGENFWVDRVTSQIKPGHKYVITDCRFQNEIDAVHSLGGMVYRIIRPGFEAVNDHVSDAGQATLKVDGEFLNDGTFEEFASLVKYVMRIDE